MTAESLAIGTKFELQIWRRNDDQLWRIQFINNRGEGIMAKGEDFTDTVERGFKHLMSSLQKEGLHHLYRDGVQVKKEQV